MTPARDPKQWFYSPSGMLDGQLAWGAIWTKKCWFSIVDIDVWARDRLFRLDETRASVTKYCFFLIKMSERPAGNLYGYLISSARTPSVQALFGEYIDCLYVYMILLTCWVKRINRYFGEHHPKYLLILLNMCLSGGDWRPFPNPSLSIFKRIKKYFGWYSPKYVLILLTQ